MTQIPLTTADQPSLAGGALDPNDPAHPGQADYTPSFLAHVYDPLVLGFANRFVWRCPSRAILRLYDDHVADDHLDVGPGTGWFLERCHFPGQLPRVTLLDVNRHVLEAAVQRLVSLQPRAHQANLLEPIGLGPSSFDSIAMTHVLHCLPGTLPEKARALDHMAGLLRAGGRLFGSTVLGSDAPHTPLSRAFLTFLNGKGVFSNFRDGLAGLEAELRIRFDRVEVRTIGAVALFVAHA